MEDTAVPAVRAAPPRPLGVTGEVLRDSHGQWHAVVDLGSSCAGKFPDRRSSQAMHTKQCTMQADAVEYLSLINFHVNA
jgi:hypothetical protein